MLSILQENIQGETETETDKSIYLYFCWEVSSNNIRIISLEWVPLFNIPPHSDLA